MSIISRCDHLFVLDSYPPTNPDRWQGGYNLKCGDGAPSSLNVGESFECLPEVTIAQSDVDAGVMHNTAR